ncbi:acyltransferase family protein [Tranquillimonas alkanivorans]|uniref:Peptidoglycan/LPS O-acetylase OafA/YrhL, contains acyltransferase and SGNH-hydrolase domains n=1 Tax=Tranquillimonas alkanivorans TaxID=441119 RepID=A0A1I5L973_9RHOB|nr:acyltransferase [Tranquillimonas alkanivorans]SFO93722.1 Peptidoglycan/LPS O-acetylase OafA/YrhL, contains acyltransferase and SGNH-hydrolase domains [Tranquillimonas alkanivorans]
MPRLPGLQALRAAAALMVLIGHAMAEAAHYIGPLPGSGLPWTRGVDLFFVISGFVIALSAARVPPDPAGAVDFLRRRALRVVPLYYVFTTLMVAVLLAMPSGVKDTPLDSAQIVHSYLFLPYERPDGRIAPVLSLGWTLNYEVGFYAVVAAALLLRRGLGLVLAVLSALVVAGLAWEPRQPGAVFWTNPIVFEFLFGMALARVWRAGVRLPAPGLAAGGLAAGVVLLVALHETALPRVVAAGGPAALIVAAVTLCRPPPLPGLALGEASYALYLSHRFVLRALTLLLLPVLPAGSGAAVVYTASAVAASVVIALLVHRHLERPLMRALGQPLHGRPA